MEEKTIGILGGMGPEATLDLYAKIIRRTPAQKDQEHLRVIICSNPKVPDRTAAILRGGEDPVPEMVFSGQSLEKAGADFLIIPCISAHYFLDGLRRELTLPILSAFDATAGYIRENHPEIKKVGLLATTGTIESGKFAARLAAHGLETLTPSREIREEVMTAIYNIKADPTGKAIDSSKSILVRAAESVFAAGAEGVIAGCTEIPLALKAGDLDKPLFDTLDILALAAVRAARSGEEAFNV